MIVLKHFNKDMILSGEEAEQYKNSIKEVFKDFMREQGHYLGGDNVGSFGVGIDMDARKIDDIMVNLIEKLQGIDKDRLLTFLLTMQIVNIPKDVLAIAFKEAFVDDRI